MEVLYAVGGIKSKMGRIFSLPAETGGFSVPLVGEKADNKESAYKISLHRPITCGSRLSSIQDHYYYHYISSHSK